MIAHGPDRFLKPGHPEIGEPATERGRLERVEMAVDVDHDRQPLAETPTQALDVVDRELVQLHRADPRVDGALGLAHDKFRIAQRGQTRVGGHGLMPGTAEQLQHGRIQPLAQQVPQRDVEAGQGHREDALVGIAIAVVPQLEPQSADLARVATEVDGYTVSAKTLTLAAAADSANAIVTAVDDSDIDSDESIEVTAMLDGAVIGVRQTITIADNDGENTAPVFSPQSVTRQVAENAEPGTAGGSPVAATDADNHPLTYTLGGAGRYRPRRASSTTMRPRRTPTR